MRRYKCRQCGISFTLDVQSNIEEVAKQYACVGVPAQKPAPPGFFTRVGHYAKAVGNWVVGGMPKRTPEQIANILEICKQCSLYDSQRQICTRCGCRATKSSSAWVNKIAMGTEVCPQGKWGNVMGTESLRNLIDRVYVINLQQRPDRLRPFFHRLRDYGWPFKEPIIYRAIHGDTVGVADGCTQGGGAYGCRESHKRILQDCLMDGVQTVMILEDDAEIQEGFPQAVEEFFAKVPSTWEGIMLGGQHHAAPMEIGIPGVVRVRYAQRTHAYIAKSSYQKALQKRWGNCSVHIDWVMRDWQHTREVYAPDPWLIGQAGGRSDIRATVKPQEWWQRNSTPQPEADQTLIVLRAPRSVMEELVERGWHCGYSRNRDTGIDTGLQQVESSEQATKAIQQWLQYVLPESRAAGMIPTLWHPEITMQMVQQSYAGKVVEIVANTVEEAESQLPEECRTAMEVFATTGNHVPVVYLEAPDDVCNEMTQKGGWLFVTPDMDIRAAYRRARREGKIVTIRGGSGDCPFPVVAIKAHTYPEVIEQWIH